MAVTIASLHGTQAFQLANAHGVSSAAIQALIAPSLTAEGFVQEVKTGFRATFFQADFEAIIGSEGVVVEVERGKTLDNNMDMLDLWKCHVHPFAGHLILLVPVWYVKQTKDKVTDEPRETFMGTYSKVCSRMELFFQPGNETNVKSLHVVGY